MHDIHIHDVYFPSHVCYFSCRVFALRIYFYDVARMLCITTDGDVPFCSVMICAGNVYTCNYAIGNNHCYYLDYATSGVLINGGACINNTNGVKLNSGKKWVSFLLSYMYTKDGTTLTHIYSICDFQFLTLLNFVEDFKMSKIKWLLSIVAIFEITHQ